MTNSAPPVAARTKAADVQSDANLHVSVGAPTKRFHLWVQGPAWLLGFCGVALGFLMVVRNYDSAAGWFAVSVAVTLAVVGSFRAPFTLGETSVSTAPGKKRSTPTTPASRPSGR
jgi:uncharacterized membrane protein